MIYEKAIPFNYGEFAKAELFLEKIKEIYEEVQKDYSLRKNLQLNDLGFSIEDDLLKVKMYFVLEDNIH